MTLFPPLMLQVRSLVVARLSKRHQLRCLDPESVREQSQQRHYPHEGTQKQDGLQECSDLLRSRHHVPEISQEGLKTSASLRTMTAENTKHTSSQRAQSSAPSPSSKTPTPYRQIRAYYDDETITVYQAYSATIGDAAVREQKLSASTDFSYGRMTWIKPSWTWMCYRSDYSYKDPRQARILAIKMKHEHFIELLSHAFVGHGAATGEGVRVQWDPERSVRIGKLEYRSIQIGIGRQLSQKWVEEWIVGIEDVTERARELKRVVSDDKSIGLEKLVEMGLVPVERPYAVPELIEKILKMDSMEADT